MVPVVNENDTVADDEIRFGDNDRIAALVANLIRADVLVMLTDTAGLFTADPRLDGERVAHRADRRGRRGARRRGRRRRLGAWQRRHGHQARGGPHRGVVGSTGRDRGGRRAGRGHRRDRRTGRSAPRSRPAPERLTSRKLWIAFAVGASGRVVVDDGARRALVSDGRSLLAAGVRSVEGEFEAESAVEVVDESGRVFAKGLVTMDAAAVRGRGGPPDRAICPAGTPTEVIHRDDLVVLA